VCVCVCVHYTRTHGWSYNNNITLLRARFIIDDDDDVSVSTNYLRARQKQHRFCFLSPCVCCVCGVCNQSAPPPPLDLSTRVFVGSKHVVVSLLIFNPAKFDLCCVCVFGVQQTAIARRGLLEHIFKWRHRTVEIPTMTRLVVVLQ
jgi:hypothetical protein